MEKKFREIFEQRVGKINNALDKFSREKDNPQNILYKSIRYSLLAGGKRIRPVIVMSVCDMCGGDENVAVPFACAVEYMHTASLIHDDLPIMDNDELRRGRPTNHIKFGSNIALLAGDAMLADAFLIASGADYGNIDKGNIIKALSVLAECNGSDGVAGGQVVDILNENTNADLIGLYYTDLLKTSALIRCSARIGAYLAEAGEEEVNAVDRYAENLGIAFQIQDDILDVEGDEKLIGKCVGSDKKSMKSTYVSVCGLDKAKELAKEYSEKALVELGIFGEKAEFLKELTEMLLNRKN